MRVPSRIVYRSVLQPGQHFENINFNITRSSVNETLIPKKTQLRSEARREYTEACFRASRAKRAPWSQFD